MTDVAVASSTQSSVTAIGGPGDLRRGRDTAGADCRFVTETRQRMRARQMAAVTAGLVLASLLALPSAGGQTDVAEATDGPVAPSQWPSSFLAAPQIEAWPNAMRIFGPDRFQTALAVALTMRGRGGFPFESADATSGDGRSLAAADGWWGLGVCPRSVIVVASDSPADALTAAALSDSTGGSSEPYLRRAAASDPLFDPIGGFNRVDTFAAPILLTGSARSGATTLNHAARLAAQDLRRGGCNAARQAIIVGGAAAVPAAVESELVSIGYSEVFRVSGANRYGTAAAVATSLGTAPIPAGVDGCADPSAADGDAVMTFYANSVIEWRPRARECELLGRTVVLTGGVDALAAGWWTSFWQVPVLLHDGTDTLPDETAAALSLLDVENLIVLGGKGQIPDSVADLATQIARAEQLRVSGPDRYATSVAMAQHFGGWWPTQQGEHFARSSVCLVASSGRGADARGWPDALGASAWCGAASASSPSQEPYVVERFIGPVTALEPGSVASARASTRGQSDTAPPRPKHSAVPILLVPAGAPELPESVYELLLRSFTARRRCVDAVGGLRSYGAIDFADYGAALDTGACFEPGFAVAFGGPSVISPSLLAQVSSMVSGRLAPASEPPLPVLVGSQVPDRDDPTRIEKASRAKRGVGAFATGLAFDGTVYYRADETGNIGGHSSAGNGSSSASAAVPAGRHLLCLPRATYEEARWLVVETAQGRAPTMVGDLPALGWYRLDNDGVPRSQGDGAPGCLAVKLPENDPVIVRAVGPYGRSSLPVALVANEYRRFRITDVIEGGDPLHVGLPGDVDPELGGTTRWSFRATNMNVDAHLPPRREDVTDAFLSVEISRGIGQEAPDEFTALWSVETALGTVTGVADGEALFVAGTWELRGVSALRSGTWLRDEFGPEPEAPSEVAAGVLVAGLADGGYGTGGFMAIVNTHNPTNDDDTVAWRVDAFINAAP